MIEYLLSVIENYSQIAWLIILLVAFAESMAIVGLFVPGWLLLVGAGTLIGADTLSFYPIMFAAYIGAVVGEYMSFYLGVKYQNNILNNTWFKKHNQLIEQSRNFFHNYGAIGVFIGRFFGPTRAFLPLMAGISGMKNATFIWINITSGLIWAPLYLIPGILIGAAFNLDPDEAKYLLGIIFLISLVIYFAYKNTLKLVKTLNNYSTSNNNKIKFLDALKLLLWWAIVGCCMFIFITSTYWNLLKKILVILFQKL